jgi:hypothetical protein
MENLEVLLLSLTVNNNKEDEVFQFYLMLKLIFLKFGRKSIYICSDTRSIIYALPIFGKSKINSLSVKTKSIYLNPKTFSMKRIVYKIVLLLLFSVTITNSYGQGEVSRFIFLGHCYQHWNNGGPSRVDERVQQMDLSNYDVIMLGGDVTPATLSKYSTLEHVDEVFDVKSQNTLWALGNHDYLNGNVDWYRFLTGRETFYSYHHKGVSFFVYDSSLNPSDCEQLNAQYEMLTQFCDTISQSSQFLLIFHHGIWKDIPGIKNPSLIGHTLLTHYNAHCNSSESTFKEAIYPMLVKVQQRGIDVYCIMGDAGSNGTHYAQRSADGITFMASGLEKSKYFKQADEYALQPDDRFLEFEFSQSERTLSYQFVNLDSLLNSENRY